MSAGQLEISLVHLSSSYAIDHGLWSENENGILYNGQQPGSAVNSSVNLGGFVSY